MATAGSQHATAVGGTHALTEAMLVDALAVRRLECSFHYLNFYILFDNRTAKIVFFNLNDKFFLKIFSLEPVVDAPGAHTPLLQAVTAHQLGYLFVDVSSFEVEDAVLETVAHPGIEIVEGGDCTGDDEIESVGKGFRTGIDYGNIVESQAFSDGLCDDGLLADTVTQSERDSGEEHCKGNPGETTACSDIQDRKAGGRSR